MLGLSAGEGGGWDSAWKGSYFNVSLTDTTPKVRHGFGVWCIPKSRHKLEWQPGRNSAHPMFYLNRPLHSSTFPTPCSCTILPQACSTLGKLLQKFQPVLKPDGAMAQARSRSLESFWSKQVTRPPWSQWEMLSSAWHFWKGGKNQATYLCA